MVVTMKKAHVLELLNEHRQSHIDEYSRQVLGWQEDMKRYETDLAKWRDSISLSVFDTNEVKRPQEPYKPASYLKYYDELKDMIEYHVEDNICLDENDFDKIVKDEFGWKGSFLAASNAYSR